MHSSIDKVWLSSAAYRSCERNGSRAKRVKVSPCLQADGEQTDYISVISYVLILHDNWQINYSILFRSSQTPNTRRAGFPNLNIPSGPSPSPGAGLNSVSFHINEEHYTG